MDSSRSFRTRLRTRLGECAAIRPPTASPLRPSWLALIVLGAGGYALVLNALVFAHRTFAWVTASTGGLVRPTLVANVFGLLVLFGALRRWAGLEPRAVGIRWGAPRLAGSLLVGCWLAVQAVGVLALWGRGLPVAPRFDLDALLLATGTVLSQAAGVALFEEVVYRGLLFGTLATRFDARLERSWLAFTGAIAVSAAVFAIVHVPRRLRLGTVTGSLEGDLFALFVVGVTFAVVYLRTGSLLLTVGVHALYNRPVSPVLSPESARAVFAVVLAVLVVAWPLVDRLSATENATANGRRRSPE
jgi:membrane protease YdiL (CAAX protease family)